MRVNGFEAPYSRDQVTSWILQPFMMGVFIAFVAALLGGTKRIAILIPDCALIVVMLLAWYICESRDPSKERAPSSFQLLPVPPKMTRYCTLCCKNSPGLDHHCTWLNTCIADNNYEAFYYLVVAATLKTVFQAAIGILMATLWFSEVKTRVPTDWETPIRALLWIHNIITLSLANSYLLLSGFHTYLLIIRSGTYDFILENGSDGLCARMLKCRCFLKGGKRRASTKKRSSTKPGPKSKVTAAPASTPGKPKDGSSRGDAALERRREMEQWKAEWMSKHGANDDSKTAETKPKDRCAVAPSPVADVSPSDVVLPGSASHDSSSSDASGSEGGHVQIEVPSGLHESEGVVQKEKDRASESPRGRRTDL
ncbi:hypothetical protein P43SY_007688 [Pythium insidiosum]|uniref:Palmitoyltransferase n=1 Tax=Pythium insidiosum TaxID=114742 RepID=A0AAD5Q4F6_PYTIN|nr:hypothetical protein P43SY_007688 [Pythium insidiosum]